MVEVTEATLRTLQNMLTNWSKIAGNCTAAEGKSLHKPPRWTRTPLLYSCDEVSCLICVSGTALQTQHCAKHTTRASTSGSMCTTRAFTWKRLHGWTMFATHLSFVPLADMILAVADWTEPVVRGAFSLGAQQFYKQQLITEIG